MSESCSTSQRGLVQADIDASCRVPLLILFCGASLWLLVAAVAGVLASMSFHKPDMFADKMWLSYGRILPFAKTALIYGFCLPAGMGIALWLAARLSQAKLAGGFISVVAAKLWNLGVFIGAFGILCGASTGYEGFEIPRYAGVLLFVASLLFGFVALLTIHRRAEKQLYPSQWFIIGAVFWFPWILSTALCLLSTAPVRGVTQAVVHYWYLNNLQFVVLGLLGLGALFYFVPKLAGKDLHSRYLALFTFITLIAFGSWVGIPEGGPLPAWMGVVSGVAALFALAPALSVVENLRHTCCIKAAAPEAKFFSLASLFFLVASVLNMVGALPNLTRQLDFTLFRTAQSQVLVLGFFGMVALGGIYHILPRVAGMAWHRPALVRLNFWVAVLGVVFIALPFLVGGWQQGAKLAQPSVGFLDIAKGTLMPIRMASLGETLWAISALLLTVNVFSLVIARVRASAKPFVAEITTPVTAAEVKP
jgi:cytochrome c oxidase cbb3-type subunit 1